MASYTTNLGLIKPDQTDQASITPINDNSDILDEKVGALGAVPLSLSHLMQRQEHWSRYLQITYKEAFYECFL